jgi:hypothetical protein
MEERKPVEPEPNPSDMNARVKRLENMVKELTDKLQLNARPEKPKRKEHK